MTDVNKVQKATLNVVCFIFFKTMGEDIAKCQQTRTEKVHPLCLYQPPFFQNYLNLHTPHFEMYQKISISHFVLIYFISCDVILVFQSIFLTKTYPTNLTKESFENTIQLL